MTRSNGRRGNVRRAAVLLPVVGLLAAAGAACGHAGLCSRRDDRGERHFAFHRPRCRGQGRSRRPLSAAALAGAGYRRTLLAEHVVDDLVQALRHVQNTRTPMIFDLPSALLNADVDYAPSRFSVDPVVAPAPAEEPLDTAVGVIAASQRSACSAE